MDAESCHLICMESQHLFHFLHYRIMGDEFCTASLDVASTLQGQCLGLISCQASQFVGFTLSKAVAEGITHPPRLLPIECP